jgi:hypothetical protein
MVFEFVVATFAVYRSTRMLNKEPGPHGLIDKIRNTLGTEDEAKVRGSFGEGARCPYCTSIWMATITSVYYALTGRISWTAVPVYVFALSGSALGLILGYRVSEMKVLEGEHANAEELSGVPYERTTNLHREEEPVFGLN